MNDKAMQDRAFMCLELTWPDTWEVLSELTQDVMVRAMCKFAEQEIARDRIRLVHAEPYYARAE